MTTVTYGNPLAERAYATDFASPNGELGPVFVVLANSKLPAGTLTDFQTWNQTTPGGSPTGSAGNVFHAYVLRPTANANEYTVVYDSGLRTVPVPSVASGEVSTFTVDPPVAVQAHDLIGFYGEGVPVDTGVATNPDILSYPASADSSMATNVAPAQGATVKLGEPNFPIYSQDRTYSFAATVTPTVTDPGTGAEATATRRPQDRWHLERDRDQPR